MKTSLLTTLSFLLLLSSAKLLLAHSNSNKPVLDTYNNSVTSDDIYYIRAANIDLEYLSYSYGMNACPFNVVLGHSAALTYFFPISGSTSVTESTNLVVHFHVAPTDCGNPSLSLWKVNTTDTSSTYWPVVVGEFSETDPETQFIIQEAGYIGGKAAYKLVYCPPSSSCLNLTVLYVEGYSRLVVDKSGVRPASEFVFVSGSPRRIKLVTSKK